MLGGPARGKPVERAFHIVFLIRDHAPDADDEIVEAFGSGPKIADADGGVVKIRMKERGENPALRRAARIAKREVHFDEMLFALHDIAARSNSETLHGKGEAIVLRRLPLLGCQTNDGPSVKAADESFVIESQAANPW